MTCFNKITMTSISNTTLPNYSRCVCEDGGRGSMYFALKTFHSCELSILKKNTRTISLENCKSCKQTRACALICLPDLQLFREIFPVF